MCRAPVSTSVTLSSLMVMSLRPRPGPVRSPSATWFPGVPAAAPGLHDPGPQAVPYELAHPLLRGHAGLAEVEEEVADVITPAGHGRQPTAWPLSNERPTPVRRARGEPRAEPEA